MELAEKIHFEVYGLIINNTSCNVQNRVIGIICFLPMTATCMYHILFSGHGVNPRCTCAWVFLVCMCDGCWLHVCVLITMPTAIPSLQV